MATIKPMLSEVPIYEKAIQQMKEELLEATYKPYNPYLSKSLYETYHYGDDGTIKMKKRPFPQEYKPQKYPKPLGVKPEVKIEVPAPVLNYPEFRFLDKLSLELEGAWYKFRDDIHKDLSFSKDDFSPEFESVGEFTSKPFETFNEWAECLINNYPDYSCHKCGFHIHFSLKSPAHYMMCMEKVFYAKFLESLTEWGKKNVPPNDVFWARLAGANKYCQNVFIPDTQASYKEKGINRKDRRTILNYTYRHLGTIEVRVLPMFKDCKLAISAISHIVNFVEQYILENKNNKIQFNQKIIAEVPVDNSVNFNEKISIKPCNFKIGRYNFFNKNKIIKSNDRNSKINLVKSKIAEKPNNFGAWLIEDEIKKVKLSSIHDSNSDDELENENPDPNF